MGPSLPLWALVAPCLKTETIFQCCRMNFEDSVGLRPERVKHVVGGESKARRAKRAPYLVRGNVGRLLRSRGLQSPRSFLSRRGLRRPTAATVAGVLACPHPLGGSRFPQPAPVALPAADACQQMDKCSGGVFQVTSKMSPEGSSPDGL